MAFDLVIKHQKKRNKITSGDKMKKSLLSLRTAGFAAALTFGLTACGDEVTKYYDSEGSEISVTDTLLVTEVVKEQDTITVTEVNKISDTVNITEIIKVPDTVKVSEVVKIFDTVKVRTRD